MKKLYCIIIIATMLVSFAGCGTTDTGKNVDSQVSSGETSLNTGKDAEQEVEKDYLIDFQIPSKSIAENIVDEESERKLSVYLPPSYYDSDKRYPVVYFMHGYGEDGAIYVSSFKNGLDKEFNNGAKEFIVVSVDGRNQLGGSFYVNSPIFGNWEDYVVDEVVPFIDAELRTIANSESRGMCGFSMGGYTAYNIPFKHPDVFSSFITMSPGAIADGDIKSAFDSWHGNTNFKRSYAQAFSPDANNTEDFGNIPDFSGTPEDNKIVADWENGYGKLNEKVTDYLALNKPLKAMKIIYGENDTYSWIPKGCEFLSEVLTKNKIEHTIEKLPIGHGIPPEVSGKYLVPFFNEYLVY